MAAIALAACAPNDGSTVLERVATSTLPLDAESCSDMVPCASGLVCVEAALGRESNRCERPRALYAFLENDDSGEGLQRAVAQVRGSWLTERSLSPLAVLPYSMTLESGQAVLCHDRNGDAGHPCWVPDWSRYLRPGSIATKYDTFTFFGMRGLRFLVSGWRNASDRDISEVAGAELSPVMWRSNFRNTLLAAIDSFTNALALPFAFESDPSPASKTGWLSPNAPFDPGLALWDPAFNENCKTEKTGVLVPGYSDLYYYDIRATLWDRHGSAFRAMTMVNAYFQLRGLLTREQRVRWLKTLRDIGDMLSLSGSFEPGQNHGISEAAALLQLGTEFVGHDLPLVPESTSLEPAWRQLALSRLNDVISDTTLSDGAQIEQSLFYHNYELAFLIEIAKYLNLHPEAGRLDEAGSNYDRAACADGSVFDYHVEPDPALSSSNVINSGVRIALHTAMPSADLPMLGSSPTANIGLQFGPSFDIYVADNPSDPLAAQFDFVRSVGVRGAAPSPSERMQVFEDSGYVTMRSAFVPRVAAQTHVLFNTAPSRNVHAHLDALSVHLFGDDPTTSTTKDGSTLLGDSGWFSYSSDQRHYFESTLAHNTVSVDRLNQCSWTVDGKRLDPNNPNSVLIGCAALPSVPQRTPGWPAGTSMRGASLRDPNGDTRVLYQSAEAGLYAGVSHRRGVALFGREMLLVLDQLTSSSAHEFVQNWHLSSAVSDAVTQSSAETAHYRFRAPSGAAIFSGHFSRTASSRFQLQYGTCGSCVGNLCGGTACSEPTQGWYSTGENLKAPTWVLERSETANTVTWASLFLLSSLAASNPELTLTSSANASDHQVSFTLPDGMNVSLAVQNFAAQNEQVSVTYPMGGVLASYSFEGNPAAARDLEEGLAVSVTVPGETSGLVTSVSGVVDNAYRYEAGRTLLGSPNSFAFMHRPRAAFTLAFWLQMNAETVSASGGTQAIFSTSTWSNAGTGIELYFQDDVTRDNALRFLIRGNGGTPLSVGANRIVPDDRAWHHYAVTFDANLPDDQVRFFRDGVGFGRGGKALALSTAAPDAGAVIGAKPGDDLAYPLNAALDEFVVFKRALTDRDVAALYNSGRGLRAH
ncbi:MAG: heparinase II/III domain-containing protein [Myxococcota bacterium]